MKNLKLLLAFLVVALIGAAAAAGAVYWFTGKQAAAGAAPAHTSDKRNYKYITLDKVIVMLRRSPGETGPHYLAADLVIAATDDKEHLTKEQLPMLRSVAVKALSAFPMSKAETMTVEQFAAEVDRAFADSYAKGGKEKPFAEVMIGKLIIQ